MRSQHRTTDDPHGSRQVPAAQGTALRTLLWVVLVVSAVGNTLASLVGVPMSVHLGFGVASALCVAALIAHHLRGRR